MMGSICLMPDANWALWRLGCQMAAWQRTGFLSKDSEELCKIRNPRPHNDRSKVPNIPCPPVCGAKKWPGLKPAHYVVMSAEFCRCWRLFPPNLHHFIGLGAARGDHFDLGALLFSHQGARQRRCDGNLAFLGVRLRLTNDLPHRLFVGVFVDQRHSR